MSNVFADRVLVATATTGTGTVTLGAALAGYQNFADGGVQNGDSVRYLIVEDSDWEIGTGVYSSSGPTLTRAAEASSDSGDELVLAGAARVMVIASSADLAAFIKGPGSATDGNLAVFDGTTGTLLTELAAASDHQVLRRSGSALAFGAVALNQAGAVTGSLPLANGGTGGTDAATARTGLGLGTAATATLTTSATDATANRVMKVADFGLGATTPTDLTDLTVALFPGTYRVGDAATAIGAPAGATGQYVLWVGRGTTSRISCILANPVASAANQRLWFGSRNVASGAITWQRITLNLDILGTVSQSGGVPTGAILQGNASATTPAGGYVERHANGFQTLHIVVDSSDSADVTVTFTNAFLTGSAPAVAIVSVGDALHDRRIVSISPTAVTFAVRDGSGARIAAPTHLTITGRWSDMT
jgi:hypothetical protein